MASGMGQGGMGAPAIGGNVGPAAPAAPAQAGSADSSRALEEALLGTYGDQMELGALDKQMAQADALRSLEGGPEMRSAGRVSVAANPLEFVGKGMQQWEGRKRAKALEPQQATIRGRIGENVKNYGLNLPE
jgi:hypothetical protein